jgi:hypothetical protein
MNRLVSIILLAVFFSASCSCVDSTRDSSETLESSALLTDSRPLWAEPIEVQTSRESIKTNVILVGSGEALANLTDSEIARLRTTARAIIERHMMHMLILRDESEVRSRDFVSPLNQEIGRDIISDVRFEPLIWSEAI